MYFPSYYIYNISICVLFQFLYYFRRIVRVDNLSSKCRPIIRSLHSRFCHPFTDLPRCRPRQMLHFPQALHGTALEHIARSPSTTPVAPQRRRPRRYIGENAHVNIYDRPAHQTWFGRLSRQPRVITISISTTLIWRGRLWWPALSHIGLGFQPNKQINTVAQISRIAIQTHRIHWPV